MISIPPLCRWTAPCPRCGIGTLLVNTAGENGPVQSGGVSHDCPHCLAARDELVEDMTRVRDQGSDWPRLGSFFRHHRQALEVAEARHGLDSPIAGALFSDLGVYFYQDADWHRALDVLPRGIPALRAYGLERAEAIHCLTCLAAAHEQLGDREQAREVDGQVYAMTRQDLGDLHPATFYWVHAYGRLATLCGDAETGLQYAQSNMAFWQRQDHEPATLEQARTYLHSSLRPNNVQGYWIATAAAEIGAALVALGDRAGARPYYQTALSYWLGAEYSPHREYYTDEMHSKLRSLS